MAELHRIDHADGSVTEVPAERGWSPVVPSAAAPENPGGGAGLASSPPPGFSPADLREAAAQGALRGAVEAASTRQMPSVRWLRVRLDELDKPGHWINVRLSLSDVMMRSIQLDKPQTMVWLFGDHNLVYEDDMPALYSPFDTGADGAPLLLSEAHRAGDPLPAGGTLAFVDQLPQDVLRYAFGQATLVIIKGGRTEEEKKV